NSAKSGGRDITYVASSCPVVQSQIVTVPRSQFKVSAFPGSEQTRNNRLFQAGKTRRCPPVTIFRNRSSGLRANPSTTRGSPSGENATPRSPGFQGTSIIFQGTFFTIIFLRTSNNLTLPSQST